MKNSKTARVASFLIVGILLEGSATAQGVHNTVIGNIITIIGGILFIAGIVEIFRKSKAAAPSSPKIEA